MFDEPPKPFNRELIQGLCLEAGRIMEEASSDLAMTLPGAPELMVVHVDKLYQTAQSLIAISEAARALANAKEPSL